MNEQLSPDKILQTGLAFWASKTLMSAIEMGLFTELSGPAPSVGARLSGRAGGARVPESNRRSLRQHAGG
jgi:hypothetical protein